MARGLLATDVDGYNTLALTAAARPVLTGGEPVLMRRPRATEKTRRRKGEAAPAQVTLAGPEERIFERLRALRREIATGRRCRPTSSSTTRRCARWPR